MIIFDCDGAPVSFGIRRDGGEIATAVSRERTRESSSLLLKELSDRSTNDRNLPEMKDKDKEYCQHVEGMRRKETRA